MKAGYVSRGVYEVTLPVEWDPMLRAMAKRKRKAEKRLRDLQRQGADRK